MPYCKIEPSGCGEHHGNTKIRIDFFLNPQDVGYEKCYVYAPVIGDNLLYLTSRHKGNPDPTAYQKWLDSLPHEWQLNPFHSHFLYFDPDVTEAEILKIAEFHLPNFYRAWCEGKHEIPGGMRKGWYRGELKDGIPVDPVRYEREMQGIEIDPDDRKYRSEVRPPRYDLTGDKDFDAYVTLLKEQAVLKAEELKLSTLRLSSDLEGETFPSTEIDVGGGAIDRASVQSIGNSTYVDRNNPANADGVIDTWEVYLTTQNANAAVIGTFSGSGTSWDDRDYETIGKITAGSKQTFSGLDNDVVTDDIVGIYPGTTGIIESVTSGGSGYGSKSGSRFGSGAQTYTFIFGSGILSLYGTGETAGAETYTKTVSMSALLKAQDDATINLDAYLKARDSETVNLSALLKGPATESVNLDTLIRALGLTKTAALDTLIKETDSETVSLDALVKALGLSKTVALSVILGTGATLTVDLDTLLKGMDSKSVDIDALLKSLNLSKTITVDTLLALVKQTETVDLDALLKGQVTEGIDIDVWLKGLALVQSINLDTLIQATGQEKTTVIDTLLEATDTETIDLDVILKGLGITKTVAVDVLLHGSAIETVSLDALLAGRGLLTVAIDLILKLLPEKALRFIIEVRDTSGNLLAILENAHGIGYTQTLNEMPTLDFNLPASDDKKEHLIWGNEIWLRDYRTGTLIRKFRIGQRRDRR